MMNHKTQQFLLNYGIGCLAIIVIVIHVFFVKTQNLSKWKGGGYGMYTENHFIYNQIYIPGMSVDSLVKDNREMKNTLGFLLLMPNKKTLNEAGALILKTTGKDSIHIQVWKPKIDSENGIYSRTLIDEIHIKNTAL